MVVRFTLKEIIKKRGLEDKSYRELAELIGISHGPLHQMVENKLRDGRPYNPSLETIDKLCSYFRCQPGDFLSFKKGKP